MKLPAAVADRPFTVAEGRRVGLTDRELRTPGLATSWWGVRAADVPDDVVSACGAALAVLPPGAVLSHVTALRLHGVEVPWRLESDGRVHATVPPGGTVSRRPQLAVHTAQDAPRATILGALRVVTPATAWVQLAGALPVDDLVVLGDSLVRRASPVSRPDLLADAVHGLAFGARGRRRAFEALGLVRPGTDSSMETRTRLVLVRAGLPEPLVNVEVRTADGRFVALPDLQYPLHRVVVEYDGDVHRTDPRLWRRDVERRQRLEDAGWAVVTATADDVLHHPDRLVRRVRRVLRSRTPSPR